ncbi:hypothetical protein V2J09_014549 [Rumex salicifolius]
MGVKNLWDILDSCKKTLPLHHLQNKRVCIDLSCWMVQLQLVYKSHCPLKDKLYLKGLFHRLRALIALNCRLVFVTDGSIPALKVSTYRRRLNIAPQVSKDVDLCKATALKRNMGSEFSCMVKEAKILGLALGIPCLDGVEEAEAQCALLNSASLCDGCFSSDSDIFLFGAKTVYREICIGEGGYVVCYDMEDIQNKLGFGRNSLMFAEFITFTLQIALALLLGCDYSCGVHGIGPNAACQFIKSIGEDTILQHLASEGISSLKKSKTLKKPTQVVESDNKENYLNYISKTNGSMRQPQNNQFSEVINAFLNPECHHADSDTVYRALSVQPFQQVKLQQICAQFLEWPPEKTDEYILPKIVERDLRRFAYLRASSSQSGVKIPLEEMPVKCPIAGIVKPRKIQGKECFQVEWECLGVHSTSIVPADLIESACPEKIIEFEQNRDEKKKMKNNQPKRRPKKNQPPLKTKDTLAELDKQLQSLLLDIDPVGYRKNSIDQQNGDMNHNTQSPIHGGAMKTDVISLLSPSPQPKQKYNSVPNLEVEVIDLSDPEESPECSRKTREVEVVDLMSDSEFERSVENARRTRELRVFLANR